MTGPDDKLRDWFVPPELIRLAKIVRGAPLPTGPTVTIERETHGTFRVVDVATGAALMTGFGSAAEAVHYALANGYRLAADDADALDFLDRTAPKDSNEGREQ